MAVKFVDNFDVSSESDEEDDYRSPPRKRRRANRVWIKVQEFQVPKDAEEAVGAEQVWRKDSSKNTLDGHKVYYRCSAGKFRRGEECPAAVYLLYHAETSAVTLFKTENNHGNHVRSLVEDYRPN